MDKQNILNYLKTNLSIFKQKYKVQNIGIFGSFARGDQRENSDIDIFVKMEPSLFDLIALKQKIEEDLKKDVDIIREHKNINPTLLKTIKKDLVYAE